MCNVVMFLNAAAVRPSSVTTPPHANEPKWMQGCHIHTSLRSNTTNPTQIDAWKFTIYLNNTNDIADTLLIYLIRVGEVNKTLLFRYSTKKVY